MKIYVFISVFAVSAQGESKGKFYYLVENEMHLFICADLAGPNRMCLHLAGRR